MIKLLFLAGSQRVQSVNKKLAACAAKQAGEMGIEAQFIDLKDFDMPIYDGDLEVEKGLPEAAKALKALFVEADGFFIASPEYNSSFSPLLKNALDWISRPHQPNEPMLAAFDGKVAALSAASPGGLGGLRGLAPLRVMLSNIGVHVVPKQFSLAKAMQAFDESGDLIDEGQITFLHSVVEQFVETSKRLGR